MKLDYRNITDLIDIRMRQIQDASLEIEYFNQEWNELSTIRKSLTKLLLLERKCWKDFKDYHEKDQNEKELKEPKKNK
jgi:hypothetical protein